MALVHIAYTFNSNEFHNYLEREIIKDGKLRLDLLQDLAALTIKSQNPEINDILSLLRVDDDWLSDVDGWHTPSKLWYTLALIPALKSCPSLNNNRFGRSDTVLEMILPLISWKADEINELILGRFVSTILHEYGNQQFLAEFDVYGGCLSVKDIYRILRHLEESHEAFTSQSSKFVPKIREWIEHQTLPFTDILGFAYYDAIDMLQTAINRNESLYLFRNF